MSIGAFTFTDLTAGGIVAIAVLLVFIGQLIPRWVVTQIKAQADAAVKSAQLEAANWRTAYQAVVQAREVQAKQLDDLLELATTSDAFIRSLQHASMRRLEP